MKERNVSELSSGQSCKGANGCHGNGEGRNFLLADCSDDGAARFEQAFKEAGIERPLHVVPDGEEAIAYLGGGGVYTDRNEYPMPSVVLLNLSLPRKDGFEVLNWIRERPNLKSLVVVLLTASNRRDDADRARNLGADYYLTKPGSFDELVKWSRCLDSWLGGDYLS